MKPKKAEIVLAVGRTSCGKTYFVRQRVAKLPKSMLIVYVDHLDMHKGVKHYSIDSLKAGIRAGQKRVVFVPSDTDEVCRSQFNKVCEIVYKLGHCGFVVEELRRYTSAQKAPKWWSDLTGEGAHHCQVKIYATTQRPSQIDKDFMSNCSEIRSGGFSYDGDAKAVASCMYGVTPDELLTLQDGFFVHKLPDKTIERGQIPVT